jgi:integrase/recombinase XerD
MPKLHLPYALWPEADRQLWERATTGDDPFSDAAGMRLAKTSQRRYLFGWRRFLGFLTVDDPAVLEMAPFDRLTLERVRKFAAHLAETNAPQSVAIQIDALYKAARVMLPGHDWNWLKSVKARLYATAPTHASAAPVVTSVQLLELGLKLMEESRLALNMPVGMTSAVKYRDGLMIALLAFIPLRRKNLAAIEIGRHLVQDDDGWSIIIPGGETKTGAPIEFAIPKLLSPYLADYLDYMRPRMLKNSHCLALWVSPKGGALSYSAIWDILTRHTIGRLGVRVAPHDVRDAAATTWAVTAPAQIGTARDLLAHSDLRTTTRHYNRARGIEASRAYGRLIAEQRKRRR